MKIPNTKIQTFRIIPLFFFWLMLFPLNGQTEEFAVPNLGSPYQDLGDLQTGEILHLPTGITVNFDQMMDSIATSRVIYIGETHDNIEAHIVQLEIIKNYPNNFQ